RRRSPSRAAWSGCPCAQFWPCGLDLVGVARRRMSWGWGPTIRGAHLKEVRHQRVGERLIVDVVRDLQQSPVRPGAEVRRDDIEQGPVGRRVPERAARAVETREAALGDEEAHRTLHAIELVDDEPADAR